MAALVSPAVARNRDPILAVLRRVLPASGTVLELASGSGEHAAYFAAALPHLIWLPSDPDGEALRSIDAYVAAARLPNLQSPLMLDATRADWPVAAADAIVAINMVHIAPWAAAEGLLAGAARLLRDGAPLYLYGPYCEADRPTAPSNEAFDQSLRARNPAWGLRYVHEIVQLAAQAGFDFIERVEMPANNLSLVFRRRADR